jgi:hypothetical protein
MIRRALIVLAMTTLGLGIPSTAVAQTEPTISLTINSLTFVSSSTVDVALTLTCSEEIPGELDVLIGPDLSGRYPGYLHHFFVPQPQTQMEYTCLTGENDLTIPVQTGPEFLPLRFYPGQQLFVDATFFYCTPDLCTAQEDQGVFVVQR